MSIITALIGPLLHYSFSYYPIENLTVLILFTISKWPESASVIYGIIVYKLTKLSGLTFHL
jgi:hypothetical protein